MGNYDPRAPRRSYRGEERFFPLLDEIGLELIRLGLIRLGLSAPRAQGIAFFLADQRALERHQGVTSRVEYRQALREITPDELRRAALEGARARVLVAS